METFIILVSLVASAAGSLVLLACLAGKRAQLIKAYNIQKEHEKIEENIRKARSATEEEDVSLSAGTAM